MYIGHNETKNKYLLYLRHSKRNGSKVGKPINKYLCSIDKDEIEEASYEDLGVVLCDIWDTINQKIAQIPEIIRIELAEEFKKLPQLLIEKLVKLAKIDEEFEM